MTPTLATEVKVKDLQVLQGINNYETARRTLVVIRDAYRARAVTVWHVCQYYALPESVVLALLK